MRCPKCGFNSFDYLSECRKCGADLAKTRQELGFAGGKPTTPFLLGPLLKEQKEAEPEAKEAAELDVFAELQHASLALEDDLFLSPGAAEHGVDAAGRIGLLDRAQAPLPKTAKVSSQPAEADDISFDLSGEQADWSSLDERMDEDFLSRPEQAEEVKKSAALADSDTKSRKKIDEETVIELSEEDLKGLFLDLEDQDSKKNEDDK